MFQYVLNSEFGCVFRFYHKNKKLLCIQFPNSEKICVLILKFRRVNLEKLRGVWRGIIHLQLNVSDIFLSSFFFLSNIFFFIIFWCGKCPIWLLSKKMLNLVPIFSCPIDLVSSNLIKCHVSLSLSRSFQLII